MPTYVLKVTLRGVEPPVWRRLRLAGTRTMGELHWAIQQAMGWTNSHLHAFRSDPRGPLITDPHFALDHAEVADEEEILVQEVLPEAGARIVYEYDFGDGWEHDVVLERAEIEASRPGRIECLGGERACPPEDVGGEGGYEDFLAAIRDPKHPEHEGLREWYAAIAKELGIPVAFDPERFDLAAVNRVLKNPDRRFDWLEDAEG